MLNYWSNRIANSFKRGILYLSLFALCTVLIPSRSHAQWTQDAWTFPAPVVAMDFIENGVLLNVGYVGLQNGEIWKTETEGGFWTAMDAPKTGTGVISCFTFKDIDHGWASWYDLDKNQGGVLQTVDGGLTWTAQSSHLPLFGIYYHAPSSSLFISQNSTSGAPIRRSTDDGATWTDMLSTNNRVRYSFWDNQTGLVGLKPIGTSGDQVSRTMNGGLAWTPVSLDTGLQFESDQPLAIPNTRLGFMVGNFDDNFMTYRTSNRGSRWERVHTFPAQPNWALSTHMEYSCSALWIQATDGIKYSVTMGESWISMDGPPNTPQDLFLKQFAFSELRIWAADGAGNIWSHPKPLMVNQTKIRMDKRFLRINSTKCESIDSNIWMMLPNMCDPFVITKLTMSGSPDIQLKNPPTLPFQLGGRDSLAFTFVSPDFDRDSAYIKIEYTVNGVPFDTTMLIIGERFRQMNAQLSFNTMKKEVGPACTMLDTTFTITNTPCDDLKIVKAWLTDSSTFRITPQTPLPLMLGASETGSIRITAAASVQGTYTSKLMVRFEYAGQLFDTAIALEYKVKTGPIAPVIPPMNFVIDNPCIKYDTVVRWLNRLCGDLRLDSVSIVPSTGVTWSGSTSLLGGQAELMRFPIRIEGPAKGKHTVKVKLSFTDFGGASFDTTITIQYEIKNGIPTKINLPPSFVFRSTSVCAPREQMLYIENTLCEPITLNSHTWVTQDPTITILSSPAYPVALAPGVKDSILLRFAPTGAGNVPAALRIQYRVQSTDQLSQVNITGIGTTQANAVISDSTLVFPEALICENVEDRFTHIKNDGCDQITINSLSQLAGSDFELIEPTSLPVTLNPGDSLKLVFRPKKRAGQHQDSIDVLYRSTSGGADQAARLRFEGFIRPAIRSIDMPTTFAFDSLDLCGPAKDTTFRIYNNGTCDTLTVDGITRTGLNSISATGTMPIRIAPGEFYEVRLTMTPGVGNTGTATFTITGTMDTTFTVAMSTSAGTGGGQSTITLAMPDSTFTVEPCGTQSRTMTITAQGGCGSITIGRVYISSTIPNQTEFTVTGTMPVTLTDGQQASYVVTYDASGTGNQQAFLVLEDGNGNEIRRIPLTATVNGTTGVLSLRLEGEGGTGAFTKLVGEKVNVQIFADQDVVAGHNLNEVAFELAYDIDLMSSTASNGQNGWNVTATPTATGTRLVFTKAATTVHDRNQPLGQVEYTVRLSEQKTTALTIGDPTLNGGDAEYARCYMRPQPSSGIVTVAVNDVCYDSTVRNFMAGREYVSIIGIRPSTVLNGSDLSDVGIEYVLAGESAVKVTVQDQLGRIVAEQTTLRTAGSHTESLRIPSVEGIYFVTLHTPNGGSATRKIVVE